MSRQGVHARVSPEGSLEILSSKEVNQLRIMVKVVSTASSASVHWPYSTAAP